MGQVINIALIDNMYELLALFMTSISPCHSDKLSMTVVLTAMNRFLNEDNGLQMAFLDGNQPERLCAPMKEYIEDRGGDSAAPNPSR